MYSATHAPFPAPSSVQNPLRAAATAASALSIELSRAARSAVRAAARGDRVRIGLVTPGRRARTGPVLALGTARKLRGEAEH